MEALERQDPEERKALARASRELLDNFAFQRAIEDLKADIIQHLSIANLEDQTVLMLGRRLSALMAIKDQLPIYVNNQKYAKKE